MTQASQTVIDDHGMLITWAIRRLNVAPQQSDDARQGGAVGLLVALQRYQEERGAFRSFASGHVLHEVRTAVGWTRRRRVHLVGLDGPDVAARIGGTEEGYDRVEAGDAVIATRTFVSTLDPADQYILRRLYHDEVPQTEIARELGINKMAISRRVATLHNLAREALAELDGVA